MDGFLQVQDEGFGDFSSCRRRTRPPHIPTISASTTSWPATA